MLLTFYPLLLCTYLLPTVHTRKVSSLCSRNGKAVSATNSILSLWKIKLFKLYSASKTKSIFCIFISLYLTPVDTGRMSWFWAGEVGDF